jgi:hypothetical protein
MQILKKILREPLIHFIVCGALVFMIYYIAEDRKPDQNKIVINNETLDRMNKRFQAQWGREPSQKEWDDLVQQEIREEVYYRRAVELGLAQDDEIIRRRLYQKMEFLYSDISEAIQPTKEQLHSYYKHHITRYSLPYNEIEKKVLNDYQYELKTKLGDSVYHSMLSDFEIEIEPYLAQPGKNSLKP